MAKQSSTQQDTVERVMHAFKEGELKSGNGGKVTNRRQAVAIGLNEAGASNQQSPAENRRNVRKSAARTKSRSSEDPTKAELYEQAKRKNVTGRSKMNKAELQRAVG